MLFAVRLGWRLLSFAQLFVDCRRQIIQCTIVEVWALGRAARAFAFRFLRRLRHVVKADLLIETLRWKLSNRNGSQETSNFFFFGHDIFPSAPPPPSGRLARLRALMQDD